MLAMTEPIITFGAPERVEWHLQNWRDWMLAGSMVKSLPRKASGGMGRTFASSFDDMVEEADVRCAAIVDAIIDSLPILQQAAVSHFYLAAVWRFHRSSPDEQIDAAKDAIGRALASRGVW